MIHFQIRKNYGKGCLSFLYLIVDDDSTDEDIKGGAINEMRKDWERTLSLRLSLHSPKPAFPTITISEYDMESNTRVKNGKVLKTKWR